jgi:hypothetical protein
MSAQVATARVKDCPAGSQQWVYGFTAGDLLGGKGAGVAEMIPPACCSPFRLPIARVAAAHAAIAARR